MFESFIQHARNVTFALQKEAAARSGFAEWYASKQDEMSTDPLCRWFVRARNRITKQGQDVLAYSIRFDDVPIPFDRAPQGFHGCVITQDEAHWLTHRDTDDQQLIPMPSVPSLPWTDAPPGTKRAILSYDGAHWEVEKEARSPTLVAIKGIRFKADIQAAEPPRQHLCQVLSDRHDPVHLADVYLAYLSGLVAEARRMFVN